jgi:hypothetical protein
MVEVFPVIKSERYIKTMEFFNQLREPEKSQAIANYDENHGIKIPDNLFIALEYGFSWEESPERCNYWKNIASNIEDSTYFNKQEAVHCPTQEEFDYVTEKLGYELSLIDPFDIYTTDSCIEIGFKCCGRKSDFKNYTILSFQEWCTKYNHEGLKTWVAKEGDWVYVLNKSSSCLLAGDIVKCDLNHPTGTAHFETIRKTATSPDSYLDYNDYRKATQAEIDSVTKSNQWTHDNWYVEVSSQEEADMVIEAADKMYGKTSKSRIKYTEDWKYVSWFSGNYFGPLNTNHLAKSAKARSISDFMPITSNIVSTVSNNNPPPMYREQLMHTVRTEHPPVPTRQECKIQQYPLTLSESFKVKSNPKLLDNNINKISSINISLKQKSKTKKL